MKTATLAVAFFIWQRDFVVRLLAIVAFATFVELHGNER